jgi:hypothetical protein
LETRGIVRHIQLKSNYRGEKKAAEVDINTGLARKPSGCVIWVQFEQQTFELGFSRPGPDEAGAAGVRAAAALDHQAQGRARHPKKAAGKPGSRRRACRTLELVEEALELVALAVESLGPAEALFAPDKPPQRAISASSER